MKDKKFIKIGVAVIAIILVIVLVVTLITKPEKITNLFNGSNEEQITKFVENNNISIEFKNQSYADGYLILEYNLKEKSNSNYIKNTVENFDGFGLFLDTEVLLNGKDVSEEYGKSQIAKKVSDTEANIFEFVEIPESKLPSEATISVRVYDSAQIILETEEDFVDYEDELEEEYDEEEYDDEEYDEEEYDDEEYDDEEAVEEYDEEFDDTEYDEEDEEYGEFYEEVEGEYIEGESEEDFEEDEEYDDEEDIEVTSENDETYIGTLLNKINKETLKSNAKIIKRTNNIYSYGDLDIKYADIIELDSYKFIIAEQEIKNVSYEDIYMLEEDTPSIDDYELNLMDKNGNSIPTEQNISSTIILEDGRDYYEADVDEFENATMKYSIILSPLDSSIEEFKIIPFIAQYTNGDEVNSKTWNSIDTLAEQTSEYDGTIKVTNIEKTDENIIFTYEISGFITQEDNQIIIRNPDIEDYVVPSEYYIENGEFKISFDYEDGLEEAEEEMEYDLIITKDAENLQYTLFQGVNIVKLGEGFEL